MKLYPGLSEDRKRVLAEERTKSTVAALGFDRAVISVGIEEIGPEDWDRCVIKPDIEAKPQTIYKPRGMQAL